MILVNILPAVGVKVRVLKGQLLLIQVRVDVSIKGVPSNDLEIHEADGEEGVEEPVYVSDRRHAIVAVYDPDDPHPVPDFHETQNDEEEGVMAVGTSMPEHQSPQVPEVRDRVVSKGGCLVALFSLDTYSYVGRLDHVYVIEAITNRQSCLFVL